MTIALIGLGNWGKNHLRVLKTLNLLTNNQGISNDSVVNLLKIKKGFENAVYAALTNELDAKLKKSSKRWVKKNIGNIFLIFF